MAIENMRKNGEDPLILDSGDMFFSTTKINENNLKSEKHRCETMLTVYDKIGCDGFNIGKYELLAGISYLKSMSEKYPQVPFISANIRDKKNKELIFAPYRIVKKDNLNIGIIGLTNMVPDTMKSIIVDDYVIAGNDYINTLKNEVDIIVMLINGDRNSQASMPKKFEEADFIFTSGSTHRTNSSNPQAKGGPFLYSNGKQGKYLTVIDLEINTINSPIVDISSHEQKKKQFNNRLKRLQKKDPEKKLEELYANQENILNMIKRYRNDLKKEESIIKSAINKMNFRNVALNKSFKDDPEILALVDNALEACSTLDLSNQKKTNKIKKPPKSIKKNKKSKYPKPSKIKTKQ